MSDPMLKSIIDKLNTGDTNSVTEKEISIGVYYELKSLNDKLEVLDDKFNASLRVIDDKSKILAEAIVRQDAKVEKLDAFRVEYQTYSKLIPFSALAISTIGTLIVIWQTIH